MRESIKKIIFVEKKLPSSDSSIEDKIEWLLFSLGMLSKKDQKQGMKEVFKEVIRLSKEKEYFTLDDIYERVSLSRTTTYHHLNKLRTSGIVIKERKGYTLVSRSLESCIEEIEYEIGRILKKIKKVSRDVDEIFNKV